MNLLINYTDFIENNSSQANGLLNRLLAHCWAKGCFSNERTQSALAEGLAGEKNIFEQLKVAKDFFPHTRSKLPA